MWCHIHSEKKFRPFRRPPRSSDHLARSTTFVTYFVINRTNSSNIPDKDDDGSDPELSFDDIDDDEDMIEIEQALEGLVAFT